MRKLSAPYIFPITSPPIKNGIVEVSDDGTIINLYPNTQTHNEASVEFYDGIIVPGFVNCHTHIELSYLKGEISPKRGLTSFISDIISQPKPSNQIQSMESAFEIMYKEGIVAIGDVCNTTVSDIAKQQWQNKIHSYSFCEALGRNPDAAQSIFETHRNNQQCYRAIDLSASVVPHAPYSLSEELLSLIVANSTKEEVLTIHNQECKAENLLFRDNKGAMYDFFTRQLAHAKEWYGATGTSSLQSIFPILQKHSGHWILVHNTFSSEEDLQLIGQNRNLFVCLCPKSNLYIEDTLPPIKNIQNYISEDNIVLGTDSLASNDTLSILEEIKFLGNVPIETAFRWATINGARALRMDDKLGSLEIGKKPGINLISSIDWDNINLKSISNMTKLL